MYLARKAPGRETEPETGKNPESCMSGNLEILRGHKELSTNNCCKFMAIFIVFPGFCLKQLQQLFSDNS